MGHPEKSTPKLICEELFADKAIFDTYDGQRIEITKGFFGGYFEGFESIKWKAYGIVPLKIENTDPVSGVLVTSIEKRVAKDGDNNGFPLPCLW